MKKRLLDRRKVKIAELEANDVDAAMLAEEEMKIIKEDADALQEAERQAAVELEATLERKRKIDEDAMAQAMEDLKLAEIETAKAKATEAAIRAFQQKEDEQQKEEEDRMKKKAEELRHHLERTETNLAQEKKLRQTQQHGRLQEQLAAKKAKKAAELQERAERERAELAEKQKAEAEEREKLRLEKISWTERLHEIMETAASLDISIPEMEDFCFQESLGKKIVPETQMSECVAVVLKERHDHEMTVLLSACFEQRISELKKVVTAVVDEATKARVHHLEGLGRAEEGEEPMTEEQKAEAIAKFDAEYNAKQSAAEAGVISQLEPKHMTEQMGLRQQQLTEISSIVALYMDPETLAKLHASSGKSQEQELREYQEKVEKERKAREEAMAKERADTEAALRAKMQADMEVMKSQLEAERKAAEEDFAAKKALMDKQKEEFEKKKEVDEGSMAQEEKDRIRIAFEKESAAAQAELDAAKSKGRDKLKDRLKKRRQSTVTTATGVAAQVAGADAAAASTAEGTGKPDRSPRMPPPDGLVESAHAVAGIASEKMEGGKGEGEGEGEGAAPVKKVGFAGFGVGKKKGGLFAAVKKMKSIRHLHNISEDTDENAGAGAGPDTENVKAIESKIDRIEQMMEQLEKSSVAEFQRLKDKFSEVTPVYPMPAVIPHPSKGGKAARKAHTTGGYTYRDKDEPSPIGSTVVPMDDSEIALTEKARIEYGKTLATLLGLKSLTIKIARQLPPSPTLGNAFAASYAYVSTEDTLYVHHQRLGSSGDFGLMVIHALSHIKSNPHDLSNDADPTFLKEFYRNLRVLSQDLFKKSSTSAGGSLAIAGGGGGMARSRSKQGLTNKGLAKSMGTRSSTDLPPVSEDGGETSATGLDTAQAPANYFSPDALAERMKLYAEFAP